MVKKNFGIIKYKNIIKRIIAALSVFFILASGTVFAEPPAAGEYESGDFHFNDNGEITRYYGGESVYIPSTLNGVSIVSIADMVFFDLGISSVYIDEGIKSIGSAAFEGSNIIDVNIASSVNTVGDRAFANCTELAYVMVHSDQISLGTEAFAGTGHIEFLIPCFTDTEQFAQKIIQAKGNSDFEFHFIHDNISESTDKPNVYVCKDCGYESEPFDEEYLPFEDVSSDAWYYGYVSTAYGFGILNGKSETVFDPDAGMTCAEAVKIAACIHSYQTNYTINPTEENRGKWYDPYFTYCYNYGIIEDNIHFDADAQITRSQMAYLFSRCDTEPHYINDVPLTDIPDIYDTTPFAYEILDLYNKGIAVGSDKNFTYNPDSNIKRSETAALISRILCWDMRIELPKG